MKGIKLLLLSFLIVTSLSLVAQDTTITFKFNNFMVVDGTPKDTLIFDIEAKANVAGTFLWGSQIVFNYNTAVFGTSIAGITAVSKIGILQPYPTYIILKTNSGTNRMLINIYRPLDTVKTSILAAVPTTYGGLIRVKMLIDNPGTAGVYFYQPLMNSPRQKFVTTGDNGKFPYAGRPYGVTYYFNDLINITTDITVLDLLISEVGNPSNSSAKFVEVYNAGANAVNFGIYPWYLTRETDGGGTYANVQLSGTLPAGGVYVIGTSSSDFNTAYGGKNANQYSSSVITGNGNDSYFLSTYGDFTDGNSILIDIYGEDGTNGTGEDWEYTGSHAVRHFAVTSPNDTWTKEEWCIAPAQNMDMTPGSHRVTLTWTGSASRSTEWRDTTNWAATYVPDAGHNALIPGTAAVFPHITSGDNGYCHDLTIAAGEIGSAGLVIESSVTGDGSLITYGTVTGLAEVQRFLGEDRYWYISSPVTSEVANVYLHCWLYTYNEPTSAWGEWIVPPSTPLAVMKGYATWTSSINSWNGGPPIGDTTTSYWGTLNTGNLSTTLTATGNGWNFTGNPYVSALDWQSAGITKTNLFTNAYYVWDGDNNTYASYVNGVGNNGATQYVPAAQGFFVKSASGGGNLGVSNAARAHDNLAFWKSGEESVPNLLSLTVNNTQVSDETIIHFNENASVDVDYSYDAPKFFATVSAQLFTMAGSTKMAINTFNNTTQTSAVNMGLIVPESGEYTISASNIESFDAEAPVFLEDLQLSKVINLRSTNSYTFTASPQDDPMRFVVHFTEMQGIDDPPPSEMNNIYAYHHDVYVNYYGIRGEIIIYNVLGQEITRQAAMNGLNKITLEKGNSVYVVKVIGDQTTVSRKVFIQ